MRLPLAGFAGLLFLASPALAAESSERLLVPPAGWEVVFHDNQAGTELAELVPPGQTVQDWTEMLTVQLIPGASDHTAQEVLTDQLNQVKQSCEEAFAGPLSQTHEGGYETALRAVACTKSKKWGKGELSLYKVIHGRERLYIISRSWRGEPFEKGHLPVPEDTTKAWLAFMNQVLVCDLKDGQHPCPAAPGK